MVEKTEMRVIEDKETKANTNKIRLVWRMNTIDEKMNDERSEQKNYLAKMLSKEYQFVADYSLQTVLWVIDDGETKAYCKLIRSMTFIA
jgi:hypothetical protein